MDVQEIRTAQAGLVASDMQLPRASDSDHKKEHGLETSGDRSLFMTSGVYSSVQDFWKIWVLLGFFEPGRCFPLLGH